MCLSLIKSYIQKLDPIETDLSFKGAAPNKVTAILFDVYGTLLISGSGDISIAEKESKTIEGLSALLKKYEINKEPNVLLAAFFEEIKRSHQESKLKGIDYPEVKIEHVWQNALGIYDEDILKNFSLEYELTVNPVYPMPYFKKLIQECKKKNIKLGIISNAQFFTPSILHYFLKKPLVKAGFQQDLLFYSYEYEYAKPSTYLFKKATYGLSKHNISPKNTLYVGNDMLNDMYPATQTGFMTALFAGDKRSLRLRKDDSRTNRLKPDITITHLKQLLTAIQQSK